MSRTTPRTRHGAHRGRRSILATLMPSLLAVASVAALITALAVWRGEEPVQPGAAAAQTSTGAATRTPTPTPTPTPTSVSPTPTSTPTPSESETETESETESESAFDVEVVVLNQTTRRGLAGVVADRLRAEGWTVVAVGNFRGTVPATTVYFPDGADAAATALAADLPTDRRTRPRFGNLSTSRLTVVVTDSYPG